MNFSKSINQPIWACKCRWSEVPIWERREQAPGNWWEYSSKHQYRVQAQLYGRFMRLEANNRHKFKFLGSVWLIPIMQSIQNNDVAINQVSTKIPRKKKVNKRRKSAHWFYFIIQVVHKVHWPAIDTCHFPPRLPQRNINTLSFQQPKIPNQHVHADIQFAPRTWNYMVMY